MKNSELKEGDLMWFMVTSGPAAHIPQWQRSVAINNEGVVFVPAALFNNEASVFLAACFDGDTPIIVHNRGHLYIPTFWIKREYRKDKEIVDICKKIETWLKQAGHAVNQAHDGGNSNEEG